MTSNHEPSPRTAGSSIVKRTFAELLRRLNERRWVGRIRFAGVALFAFMAYLRLQPRAAALPLETTIEGPDPAHAAGLLVFLHGRGGSNAQSGKLAKRLRDAGLPLDLAIVLIEAPFPTPFGYAWGKDAAEQATSRARVRAKLQELLGAGGPIAPRVVIAGFSQGAGLAGDIAAEEPRIGALASLSACGFWLREALPRRSGLRVLLAHGARDKVCPVIESRSLAAVLKTANVPVRYLEFDGEHEIPPQVIQALVAFASTER